MIVGSFDFLIFHCVVCVLQVCKLSLLYDWYKLKYDKGKTRLKCSSNFPPALGARTTNNQCSSSRLYSWGLYRAFLSLNCQEAQELWTQVLEKRWGERAPPTAPTTYGLRMPWATGYSTWCYWYYFCMSIVAYYFRVLLWMGKIGRSLKKIELPSFMIPTLIGKSNSAKMTLSMTSIF